MQNRFSIFGQHFRLFPFAKAADLTAAFTKRKVIACPMAGFGLPNHIRMSVGTAKENAQFLDALKDALSELGEGTICGNGVFISFREFCYIDWVFHLYPAIYKNCVSP